VPAPPPIWLSADQESAESRQEVSTSRVYGTAACSTVIFLRFATFHTASPPDLKGLIVVAISLLITLVGQLVQK
jgi:hypothetical protein